MPGKRTKWHNSGWILGGGEMSEVVKPMAEWSAAITEAIGVGVIVVSAFYALVVAGIQFLKKVEVETTFCRVRQTLGRGVLLGLEFLVAADIIHTVAVELTFITVAVLAGIVLIRTFLSFTLEVELTGRWPWEDKKP